MGLSKALYIVTSNVMILLPELEHSFPGRHVIILHTSCQTSPSFCRLVLPTL